MEVGKGREQRTYEELTFRVEKAKMREEDESVVFFEEAEYERWRRINARWKDCILSCAKVLGRTSLRRRSSSYLTMTSLPESLCVCYGQRPSQESGERGR